MDPAADHNSLIRIALSQVTGKDLEEAAEEIGVSYETIGRWRRAIEEGEEPATRINKTTRAALLAFVRGVTSRTGPPVNTHEYVDALAEAAGALELVAAGLRQKVAALRSATPVVPGFMDADRAGPHPPEDGEPS